MRKAETVLGIILCLLLGILLLSNSGKVHAQAGVPIAINTAADQVGNGSTKQMSGTCTGRWIQFIALRANSGTIRIGDSNAGAARGEEVAPGGGWLTPVSTNSSYVYSLGSFYFYAANGDSVSVTCGN